MTYMGPAIFVEPGRIVAAMQLSILLRNEHRTSEGLVRP